MSISDYIHPSWREAWQKIRQGFSPIDAGPYVDVTNDGTSYGIADLYKDRLLGQRIDFNYVQELHPFDGLEAVIEPHAERGFMVFPQRNGQAVHGGWSDWNQIGAPAATYKEAERIARDVLKRIRQREAEQRAHPDKTVIR